MNEKRAWQLINNLIEWGFDAVVATDMLEEDDAEEEYREAMEFLKAKGYPIIP